MKKYISILTLIVAFFCASTAHAGVEDMIRGNAKFNAVIVVLFIIFLGIIAFLVRLDRKIGKLEKQQETKK